MYFVEYLDWQFFIGWKSCLKFRRKPVKYLLPGSRLKLTAFYGFCYYVDVCLAFVSLFNARQFIVAMVEWYRRMPSVSRYLADLAADIKNLLSFYEGKVIMQ